MRPTTVLIDETLLYGEVEAARRRVTHQQPLRGYRYMGRRRKRELRDRAIVFEPGLRELREKSQERRRKIRADRKAQPPVKLEMHFEPDIPKGHYRDLPGIPPALRDVIEPKAVRR